MQIRTTVGVLALSALSSAPWAHAKSKPPRALEFDLATTRPEGEKERGPALVRLVNVNVLRYEAVIGTKVTFTAGPDLSLPFLPPIPGSGPALAPPPAEPAGDALLESAPDSYTQLFRKMAADLAALEAKRRTQVERPAAEALAKVGLARDEVQAGVRASDAALKASGPGGVLTIVGILQPKVKDGVDARWPTDAVLALLADIDVLQVRLKALPVEGAGGPMTWAKWYQGGNREAYDWSVARLATLRDAVDAMGPGSEPAKAMAKLQAALLEWDRVLAAVATGGTNAFAIQHEVLCGFSFNQTKSTKVELVKRDRLGTPESVTREEIVTIECTTPISISSGFGFSTLDEQDFGFVPFVKAGTDDDGKPTSTVVQHFAFKNRSNYRPIPTLLVNTRFAEPNETFAFHASMGAAVDVKSGEAGTDVEFLVGPSVSFKRTLFVTLALHLGRVPKLANGFETDDEVPEGVSEPPLEKEWKPGAALLFTLRIKP